MKPLVYIAGPITLPEPMENVHRAMKVATRLRDSDLVVPFVPHTTCIWHMIQPASYETWLAYDFEIIRHCDALLRTDGESAGADREVCVRRVPRSDGVLRRGRPAPVGTHSDRDGRVVSASDVIADFFTKQPTRIRVERSGSSPLCYIAFGSRYRKLPFDVDDASRLCDALTQFINDVNAEEHADA